MEAGRDIDTSNCSEERAELKREFGLIGAVNLVLNIILGIYLLGHCIKLDILYYKCSMYDVETAKAYKL